MRGSHGTCNSIAKSIEDKGFQNGTKGRIGGGSYFWLIDNSPDGNSLGQTLARAWYVKIKNEHKFDQEKDKDFAVIFAELQSKNTLDFRDENVIPNFCAFFEHIKKRYDNLGDTEKSNIYDLFVEKMERASGHKIDMVAGTTRFPTKGIKDPFHIAHTMHFCPIAAVRNTEIIGIICCQFSCSKEEEQMA